MLALGLAVVAAYISAATSSAVPTLHTEGNSTSPNVFCMATQCTLPMAGCLLSQKCRQCLTCMTTRCQPGDMACSTACFFRYADDAFGEVTRCGQEKRCLPPMQWTGSRCPVNAREDLSASLPTQLKGGFDAAELADGSPWTVSLGSDRVFDCFDCQQLTFQRAAANQVNVHWTARMDDQVTKAATNWRDASYTLNSLNNDTHVSTRLWTKYLLFGAKLEEHYFVLDRTDDHILYFYCGYGIGGEYQGSQVYSRVGAPTMSASTHQQFQHALTQAGAGGVSLPPIQDFCKPEARPDQCKWPVNQRLVMQLA